MAHIPLAKGLPGIRGLFAFRPETANPLCELAEVHAIASSVRAGAVWGNWYDVFDTAAPFEGFKQSGMGRRW